MIPQTSQTKRIEPQPKQRLFLQSRADIAWYGGAAGGGKSFALILDPLRYVHIRDFTAVLFRSSFPQLVNPGGLLAETVAIYPDLGGVLRKSNLTWRFPSGATIKLGYVGSDQDVLKWQGSQIAMLGFDELTHFTEYQFWYMLSRNRSACGIKPYVRATMNPDADHFAASMLAWWLDEQGYAIPERSGALRHFVRDGDTIRWVEPDALDDAGLPARSFSFVSADVYDNPALLAKDHGYLSNLLALPTVERERLLRGNWRIRATAGTVFHRDNLAFTATPPPVIA
ncbi:MAG: terminase, partial [Chloroflexaceae bacterium]|nr:terminase [Chloroflexaceae bacterium]